MTEKIFIKLVLLHIVIGILIAFYPFFSKIYAILILLTGFYYVVKNKNKNNEILYAIAYIVGSEVILRTTCGNPFYEYGKYFMLIFTFLGLFYSGFAIIKNPFWLYLLLFIPSIIVTAKNESIFEFKRKVFFEILPFCLGFLALYTFKREVSLKTIVTIIKVVILPIITNCVFLLISYSDGLNQLTSDSSSYYSSGNFAPNQVATVLGLGFTLLFFYLVIENPSKKTYWIMLLVYFIILYRGIFTFSRGGIITGIIVIICFIITLIVSKYPVNKIKEKIIMLISIILIAFYIVSYQTNNKINERYTVTNNKSTTKYGRYLQVKTDIENFNNNPIIGIGVGKGKELRKVKYNKNVSTHSEVTRMLSEHGLFGLTSLILLVFCPLILYRKDLKNIFILPFFVFWLLTINHSATRIAAPSFIYALALLKIKKEENAFEANYPQ